MSTPFSHFFTKINQISPLEHSFTEVLESIAFKPKILYFYGKMPENVSKKGKTERPKTVAIVGSRHNTPYGKDIAYKMSYALASEGIVILSGLAYGIDSISHQAALDAGGKTVAILGTPIDQIYPKGHLPLACEIVKNGGAIISEYAPRTKEYQNAPLAVDEAKKENKRYLNYKSTFLHRNRLISGLADAVVVVEAADHSGTLNTAAHALNQGKDVYAVPGNITNTYSVGCNRLIKQGAYPYTEPDDILRSLCPEKCSKKRRKNQRDLTGSNDIETKILLNLANGVQDGEQIIKKLDITASVFNEAITTLEISGKIYSLGANRWSLA